MKEKGGHFEPPMREVRLSYIGIKRTLILVNLALMSWLVACGPSGGDDPNLVIQRNLQNKINSANSTQVVEAQLSVKGTLTAQPTP